MSDRVALSVMISCIISLRAVDSARLGRARVPDDVRA